MAFVHHVGSDSGVRFREGAFVDHAVHVASVSRDMLSSNFVSRTANPVLCIPTVVAKQTTLHFGRLWELWSTILHRLIHSKVVVNSSGNAYFAIDRSR